MRQNTFGEFSTRKPWWCSGFSVVLLFVSSAAVALTTEEEDNRQVRKISEAAGEIIDTVNPRNGELSIVHKDLSIPGDGGFTIDIFRTYSLMELSAGLSASYVLSYQWTALGPGWTMRVAPRIVDENEFVAGDSGLFYYASAFDELCSGLPMGRQNEIVNGVNQPRRMDGWGAPALVLPDGSRHPLYSDGGGVAFSTSNWRVECISGAVFARSPDGTVYEFGLLSSNRRIGLYEITRFSPLLGGKQPPSRSVTYIDAIKATDRNGNWMTFQYQHLGAVVPDFTLGSYSSSASWPPGNPGSYDRARVPVSITSSDGRTVSLAYDTVSNRLTSISDNAGRLIQYQYSDVVSNGGVARKFLSKVIRPDSTEWRYDYNENGFASAPYNGTLLNPSSTIALTTQGISSQKLSKLTYPTGGTAEYEYDWTSESVVFAAPGGGGTRLYRRGERVKKRTLSSGDSWQYAYSFGGTGQYDVTTVSGPDGITKYSYMGAGYTQLSGGSTNTLPLENNAWRVGQLMEKELPDGSKEIYEYQTRELSPIRRYLFELGGVRDEKLWTADLMRRTVHINGATYITTKSNFDSYGNPGTVTEAGPNGGNRTTTLAYQNDPTKWIIGLLKDEASTASTINRTFDSNGNLLSIVNNGVTTSFTYDSQGNIATTTFPRGLIHSFSSYKRGIPQSILQPEAVNLTRVVDNAGQITSETDGEGKTRTYAYDGLGRMTATTYPRGTGLSISYTATTKTATRGDLVEITSYDGFGRPLSISLGGVVTTYSYDYKGRRIFESNPGSSIGTSYQYDALDRLTRITNADGSYQSSVYGAGSKTVTDERGKPTTYSYRSYGDPQQQWVMNIAAPDSAANVSLTRNAKDMITSATQGSFTRTYGYDSNYYLTSVTNPETGVTTYSRDAAGNMTSRTVGSSTAATFAYDGQNRLTSATYAAGTPSVTNTYNKTNKLLSSSSSAATKTFSYDDNSNLTNETVTVNGLVFAIGYGYNNLDQLSTVSYPRSGNVINYSPDTLGRPTQVSGYINSVSYWPSGQIQQIDYANGTTSYYDQNSRLWPSSFSTKLGSSYYLNSQYGYDGTGNLTSIADAADSSYNRTVTYDDLARVVSTSGPWGAGNIAYSGTGNITSQILGSWGLVYGYDVNNRLSSLSGNRTGSFAYDTYGNVVSDGNSAYTYDEVPNLVCVNCSGTTNKIVYTYDGTNHRVSATKGGVTSYEIFDSRGNQLIEFTPSQSNKLVEFIYLGGRRIAQRVTP